MVRRAIKLASGLGKHRLAHRTSGLWQWFTLPLDRLDVSRSLSLPHFVLESQPQSTQFPLSRPPHQQLNLKVKKYKINPFVEAQFGASNLKSSVTQVIIGQQSTYDTAMSWMLGGGGDVLVSRHWAARADFDLLRTHFAEAAQSQLRFVIGVVYNFGTRD